jgi:phosphoglycerate dehydrogenase-like enzyme
MVDGAVICTGCHADAFVARHTCPVLYLVELGIVGKGPAARGGHMRVVVLNDYQGVATTYADWSAVTDLELDLVREHISDEGALVDRLAGAEVVVAMRERTAFPATLFARLPDLRLLVTTGPFNAAIDVQAAIDHGVVVCGTGGMITPTSELTWGLIHAVTRNIAVDDAAMRRGGWQTTVGSGLHGRRLGILGLGRLGALVAKVGLAFGMDVVAWSQNLTDERCAEVGIRRASKDELLGTADIVSVHLVLSDRTRGLISAPELAAMKPGAILINTSRGPIVDEAALVAALHSGTIRAGLDVFDVEPLPPDHPLRTAPNTVLTPHMGYVTEECYEIFFGDIVDDIVAWQAGDPKRVIRPA